MLIEHRIDDVGECLVARKKSVPAGEQVSFEPALAEVLAQDFHDAAVDAEVDVDVRYSSHPLLSAGLVDRLKTIRGGLIRTPQAEVLTAGVELRQLAPKPPQHPGGFCVNAGR